MGLDQIANIAEISGVALVVASLIYVGYQVKETRKAVRAATAQARTDLGVQLISARWTSNIADLLVLSVDDPESLTNADGIKLKGFFTAHVRHCMNMFYQQREGYLDEFWSYGVSRVTVYWIKNYPWFVHEWESLQKTLPPDFVAFIKDELERHPESSYV